MGLEGAYLAFIEHALTVCGSVGAMCELGNQHVRPSAGVAAKTGKEYFGGRFTHVSLDLNGLDGAEVVDLSIPITRGDLLGRFDVLTNSGTSEHIVDQYQCFQNIHSLMRLGGVMIHLVPSAGHWAGHSPYHYTDGFFRELAAQCSYTLVCADEIATRGPLSVLLCRALTFDSTSIFPSRNVWENSVAQYLR